MWAFSHLPNQLKRKLNLPRRIRRGCQRSSRRVARQSTVEDLTVCIRGRSEIRVVENIEDLRPKLHVECLRNPLHGSVLDQRHIEVPKRRSRQCVASTIAERSQRWRREAFGLDVMCRVAGIHRVSAIGAGHAVGEPKSIGTSESERVTSNRGCEREAGAGLEDAAQLPTLRDDAYRSRQ